MKYWRRINISKTKEEIRQAQENLKNEIYAVEVMPGQKFLTDYN